MPRIVIGTTGPRALELSGRVADGFLLPEGSGPDAVRWARGYAGEGGEALVYAWLSVDDDRDAAAAALRPGLEAWRRADLYPTLFAAAGVEDGVVDLSLDEVRAMAVAGSPRTALARCGRAGMRGPTASSWCRGTRIAGRRWRGSWPTCGMPRTAAG